LKNSQHLIIYLLSFAVFLVVKSSSNKTNPRKKVTQSKQKPAKKVTQSKQKPAKKATPNKSKVAPQSSTKLSLASQKKIDQERSKEMQKASRPEDEVVTYGEIEFQLREITPSGKQVLVGPTFLTRFERARITGARSLQLSLGAPALIKVPEEVKDSITLATLELDAKALPISIRRVLPNGLYQDIPADWLK
jgi:DNA-directed RNA polymerases I, II, and III subunit RPABC2